VFGCLLSCKTLISGACDLFVIPGQGPGIQLLRLSWFPDTKTHKKVLKHLFV